ncbi:MAG: metallopeptidase TldD-related protein [Gammaproteobacteria bacterium]
MSADYFFELADALFRELPDDERLQINFSGEHSDFARLNHNRIRQAGHVHQGEVSLDLIQGSKHVEAQLELCWDPAADQKRLQALLERLREQRRFLPEDPHLMVPDTVQSTDERHSSELPDAGLMLEDIHAAADGLDLVGILATGDIQRGFANSLGQKNWYQRSNVHFDWSVYLDDEHRDKAVKRQLADFQWRPEQLQRKMSEVREQLEILRKPAIKLPPDHYPVYLSPDALVEILGMMAWGGFGLKSHKTGNSPLIRMVRDGRTLSPLLHLKEDTAGGVAPGFTGAGFIKQPEVSLIEYGSYNDYLVGPRSAREYAAPITGSESPQSLSMAPGVLPANHVVEALGEGLLINNLWYCNFSDRADCRITGMTRFACFWVSGGRIQAPIEVLRFDDSVYQLLGDQLAALTDHAELLLDDSTYGERSTASYRLPGALIEVMRFTL